VQLGIGQFLTLYLTRERGFSIETASLSLALFFLAASAGSLVGGNLADRLGGVRVTQISMIVSVPFLLLFLTADGWLSLASLFIGGLVLLMTIPVNVVMAQELAPTQRGVVTSLMMGFAWGIAGIVFIPLVGWIADRTGIEAVLYGVSLLPLFGYALSLALPREGTAAGH
jgi:FSR family fosmidomycin resistance protein-like MFS transporter